jgi:hypothetical protein
VAGGRDRLCGNDQTVVPVRIPAKLNADSEDAEREFRASRTRLGA